MEGESETAPGCIVKVDKAGLLVQTGEGMLLLTEVQLEGKKRMSVEAFLNGCPVEAGTYFRKC